MFFLLVACAEPEIATLGTVTADGETAEAFIGAAWGYNVDGGMMLVVSPKLEATCDQVQAWGFTDLKDTYDPSPVIDPGTCVTTFTSSSSYDPAGLDVTGNADDPAITLISNIYCAMEGGEWVDGEEGVEYSGDIWQGMAVDVTASVSGGDGSDFTWSMDATSWNGGFPYDDSRLTVDATGSLSGEGTGGWCDAMSEQPMFAN